MFPLLEELLIVAELLLGALDFLLVILDDAVVRIVHIDCAWLRPLLIGCEPRQLSNQRHLPVGQNDQTRSRGIVQGLLYYLEAL